jgi:hypothetical protein
VPRSSYAARRETTAVRVTSRIVLIGVPFST